MYSNIAVTTLAIILLGILSCSASPLANRKRRDAHFSASATFGGSRGPHGHGNDEPYMPKVEVMKDDALDQGMPEIDEHHIEQPETEPSHEDEGNVEELEPEQVDAEDSHAEPGSDHEISPPLLPENFLPMPEAESTGAKHGKSLNKINVKQHAIGSNAGVFITTS
ncbi:hypothetical protein DdX_03752 [Ditylenchus destructor]|uniref:Secreted protein n=1 Tax=Ditylenchus destructor TaxID=166010 RepID=A0AAD4NCL7_9BILA|nr:hypothetical protein DdX_03752 [Ditylenchus destructor]